MLPPETVGRPRSPFFGSDITQHPSVEGIEFGRTIDISNAPSGFFATKSEHEIEFQAGLVAPVTVEGPLMDNTINTNDWGIDESDWDSVIQQLNSRKVSLRLNHADDIDKIVGRVNAAKRIGDTVHISTEVIDEPTYEKLRHGYLRGAGFSLRGTAQKLLCAKCRSELDGARRCPIHGKVPILIRGVRLREVSIVSEPAYKVCRDALRLA